MLCIYIYIYRDIYIYIYILEQHVHLAPDLLPVLAAVDAAADEELGALHQALLRAGG